MTSVPRDSVGDVTDPALEAALAAVETLDEQPLPAHVEAFEDVHRLLVERLAEAEG